LTRSLPGGGLAIRLDRRIVLRLRQAVARDGVVGEGLRLLVVETARRLQAECFRAGVARPHVVVAADLAGAGDLPDLLTALRRCGVAPVTVRSWLDEAGLLLRDVAVDGDVTVAEVGDRSVRFVERTDGCVAMFRRPGPLDAMRTLTDVGPLAGRAPLTPTQRLLLPAVSPEEVDLVALGAGYLHALAQRWGVTRLLVVATSPAEAELRRLLTTPAPLRA
jgi:hypothetical protein